MEVRVYEREPFRGGGGIGTGRHKHLGTRSPSVCVRSGLVCV